MKTILLGILALALVFGMAVIGCDGEDWNNNNGDNGNSNGVGNNGSGIASSILTINGLPSGEWGVYVFSNGTDISTYQKITTAITDMNWQAVGGYTSQSSDNAISLYGWNGTSQTANWTGSGSYPVLLIKGSAASLEGSFFDKDNPVYRRTTVSFSNGAATINFNNFSAVVMESLTITDFPPGSSYLLVLYPTSKDLSTYENVSQAFLDSDHTAMGTLMTALGGKYNEFALFNWSSGAQAGTFTGSGNYKALLMDMNDVMNMKYFVATVNFIQGIGTIAYNSFEEVEKIITGIFNDLEYSRTSKNVTITGYAGSGNSVTIPAEIDNLPVTTIGVEAFRSKNLSNISIPDSVIEIKSGAFSYNQFTSITIPNSITKIGSYAFSSNYNLTSVDIPSSVTSIASSLFYYCNSLTNVNIPNSVTSIESYAFELCSGLTSITIPNSINHIGDGAFLYSGLTSISIPDSVVSIGSQAFNGCSNLVSISVTTGNSIYSSSDGILYNKNKTTILEYPGGKEGAFVIPNGVINIEAFAFSDCINLIEITIPNSVTNIGVSAFLRCYGLTTVTFQGTIANFDQYAFVLCGDLRAKYLAGGPGTYTTQNTGENAVWTKQQFGN